VLDSIQRGIIVEKDELLIVARVEKCPGALLETSEDSGRDSQ
jgi:hypothetical protein